MIDYIKADIDNIARSARTYLPEDAAVFVTGATGLIGASIIKGLLECNKQYGTRIKAIAFVRDEKKLAAKLGDYYRDDYLSIAVGNIMNEITCEGKVDYVIHTASVTASSFMATNPVEVSKTNLIGIYNLLDFSMQKQVRSVVYLSSVEVYGAFGTEEKTVKESELGYLDILNTRSCYSEGKRMAENICASYAKEYGLNVKIARLTQTFGAQVDEADNRLFAQLARSAAEDKDIVLHTTGESAKSYCYLTDTISALFVLLVKGASGRAYNIANSETYISVKDLAELIKDVFGQGKIRVVYDIPENGSGLGYAPPYKVNMDCSELKELGWQPEYGLKEMFARAIETIKGGKV